MRGSWGTWGADDMARPDIEKCLKDYATAKATHEPVKPDWQRATAYCRPRAYNSWVDDARPFQAQGSPTAAQRMFAYDNTGASSLRKFVAVSHRLATPDGMVYQKLTADNADLMKVGAVRRYFDEVTRLLFRRRYEPRAGFRRAQGETYRNIGVYGNGPRAVLWKPATKIYPRGGFVYRAFPMRDIFALLDSDGNPSVMFRRFYLNERQTKEKFKEDELPASLTALFTPGDKESRYFEFFHVVRPRDDYDKEAIDTRSKPFVGAYVSVEAKAYVGDEEGYLTQLYNMARTDTEAGDTYGYSPAMEALPALGAVNQMKKTGLKVGHKAADPVLLANDDGILGGRIHQTPGSVIYGGVDRTGRALVQTLPTGANWQIAEKMIVDERNDIRDPFMARIFDILLETQEMTATQVIERVAKETSLVAPLMATYQSEDIGPLTEREIALLDEHGQLPEPPPELVEANGEYSITWTSPYAKNMFADEASGFIRLQEILTNVAAQTSDASSLDWLNLDEAVPDIADIMSVRPAWVRTPKEVEAKRAKQAEAADEAAIRENGPALASVVTASMKGGQDKRAVV